MLRQAVKNFFHLCRESPVFTLVSAISLICAFVSFLFLLEKGYYLYTYNSGLYGETQTLSFQCDDATAINAVYWELTNDTVVPKMRIISLSDDVYTGLYWDTEQNNDVPYTPYGRFFSKEEMETGEKVSLLGLHFIGGLPYESMDSIWETGITINGMRFAAVGSLSDNAPNLNTPEESYAAEYFPTHIAFPLRTFLDLKVPAEFFRCVFAESLDGAQIAHLEALLGAHTEIRSLALPQLRNGIAMRILFGATVQYALIFVLSLLSIVSILLYWLRMDFRRYTIYRLCGAGRGHIAFLLSMNVTLLITLSYICAYIVILFVTRITPEGIVSFLPRHFYADIYLGALLLSLLTVNLRAIPIVYPQRIQL